MHDTVLKIELPLVTRSRDLETKSANGEKKKFND